MYEVMSRHQRGYIYEAFNAFHVRYYANQIVEGQTVRKQLSHRLCTKDRTTGCGSASSVAVRTLCEEFMHKVNQTQQTSQTLQQDMMVVAFWDAVYLPYCEEFTPVTGRTRLKASTVRGYKQIWRQHLKKHFGNRTLQQYEPEMAARLLDSLTGTLNKTSLKHVRALGSSIFERAKHPWGLVKMNPWKNVPMPKDAVDPENTTHYTPEQAEDLISVLVDHVDCQLVMALACFLGLGPAEISGLQWGDIDSNSIHIRRNRLQGVVTTTKNKWRAASVPIIDQVRVPLELWRGKCEAKADGDWLFGDLHNMVARVIKPHVKGVSECARCEKTPKASGVEWKGLYAGRRGAVTMVIEATGNVAVAQRLARHKTADTTLRVYNKGISDKGFEGGMQAFSKSLKG
jgi:integrase